MYSIFYKSKDKKGNYWNKSRMFPEFSRAFDFLTKIKLLKKQQPDQYTDILTDFEELLDDDN